MKTIFSSELENVNEQSVQYHPVVQSDVKNIDRPITFQKPLAVYIHIPFCAKRCYFCNFSIVTGKRAAENLSDDYLDALKYEMERYAQYIKHDKTKIQTIQLGGGTPTSLTAKQLENLFQYIFDKFGSDSLQEIIIEGYPSSITQDKVDVLAGIPNLKFNIGIQTFNSKNVNSVGRDHTIDEAIHAIEIAKKSNIASVGIDLICGLPSSTVEDVVYDVEKTKAMGVDHLAFYPLWIYKRTALDAMVRHDKIIKTEPDMLTKQFLTGQEMLSVAGYQRYTAFHYSSNEEHQHNYGIWQMHSREWIGFGMGAMSYLDDKLFFNDNKVKSYIEKINAQKVETGVCENMDKYENMKFSLLYGLRLLEYPVAIFKDKFNADISDVFGEQLEKLEHEHLIERNNNTIKLTTSGILKLSSIEDYINSTSA